MHFRHVGIRTELRLAFLFSLFLALPANPQQADPVEPKPDSHESSSRARTGARFVPGRVLVVLDPEVSDAESERIVMSRGGRSVGGDARIGLRLVELPPNADEMAAVRAFRNHPRVLAAELDEIVELSQVTPNDPQYPHQTHLTAIQGPLAWAKTTGSPGVIVAVIDTGVNGNHPDLAGHLLPGWNTYDNNADYADVYGHGTKVAGAITAATNNAAGVASICWDCMILPVRASYPSGSATYSALAAGLVWAADHGARVANLSYSVSNSTTVTVAAQYFMLKGGLVFASAGNYGANDASPDNPYIVTVSAIEPVSKNLYSWSNYGNNIDVTAPGCVGSTTLMNLSYGSGCGTSYSSPIAAGVAALIFSANPTLSPAKALDILKRSAADLGDPGWDIRFGAGMVDAAKAVDLAIGESSRDITAPVVTVHAPASGAKVKGAIAASASVSDAEGHVETVTFKVNSTPVCTFTAAPYSCSIDTTAFPDGSAVFSVLAADTAGNSVTVQQVITIANADTVKPVVSLLSPAAGAAVHGAVAISFAASDDTGVTGITVFAGSSTVCSLSGAATSCSWDSTKVPNGPIQLTVTARDAAGNSGSASVSLVVANPDITKPVVAITSPAPGATLSGTAAITFTASDNAGVAKIVVTAGTATLCTFNGTATSCSWNTTLVPNGSYRITVTASDAAANTQSASVDVTVNNAAIDSEKPAVSILKPAAGAAVSGTAMIAFSASDNKGVTSITVTAGSQTICSLPGTATACYWYSKQFPDGPATITVTARDAAGNSASASRDVIARNYDFYAPTVTINAPASSAKVSGSTIISFTATDNVGVKTITVAVSGQTICTLPGTATQCVWDTTKFPAGYHNIAVTAQDAAMHSRTAARTVIVANPPPETTKPVGSFAIPPSESQ